MHLNVEVEGVEAPVAVSEVEVDDIGPLRAADGVSQVERM